MKSPSKLISGILAATIIILMIVVLFVYINPSELMAKSRDAQRFRDVTALATALNTYLAEGKDFSRLKRDYFSSAYINNTSVDGTGWLGIDFTGLSSGNPMQKLPLDPILDSDNYYYKVAVSREKNTYEINVWFEDLDNQSKYANDKGDDPTAYEIGTDLALIQ